MKTTSSDPAESAFADPARAESAAIRKPIGCKTCGGRGKVLRLCRHDGTPTAVTLPKRYFRLKAGRDRIEICPTCKGKGTVYV